MTNRTGAPLVAIVGPPNAGKTTLFNGLTGARERIGNYPGVTVERVEANLRGEGSTVRVVDLPGLYSLHAESEDERVALAEIRQSTADRPDLFVLVLDATSLERHLYLFAQLADEGIPAIVVLTMMDELEKSGDRLNLDRLTEDLGVPVYAMGANRPAAREQIVDAIRREATAPRAVSPVPVFTAPFDAGLQDLADRFARIGVDASRRELLAALTEIDHPLRNYAHDFPELGEAFFTMDRNASEQDWLRPSRVVSARYDWAQRTVTRARESRPEAPRRPVSVSDRLDHVLTHRVWGLGIFVLIMYGVFLSIYTLATPLMDFIEAGFAWLSGALGPGLAGIPWLQSLVVDGLIAGVGGVVVFLPQILILFFFISVLEGTGYLARAAFLMDRLLGWCGLNGRAFIPLLSSYACAIPGVMAARVMPDAKSRLATILVAPLMSCSARLPVYIVFIGTFIEPTYGAFWAGFALFAMHLVGLAVAIPVVRILNRRVIRGKRLPFVLELPRYQWPSWPDVFRAMFNRGAIFLKTAGTIILAMSILIWAAGKYPELPASEIARIEASVPENTAQRDAVVQRQLEQAQLRQSALGRIGLTIEPAFAPLGFDWRISTAILSAFPAREVVIPSLGVVFSLGGDVDENNADLRTALAKATWPDGRPLFTIWTALGLMVFFALCAQCMSTLAAVKRETGTWKWPIFMFVYMTTLAYLAAWLIHMIGQYVGR